MHPHLRKKAREALGDKKVLAKMVKDGIVKADRHRDKIPEAWKNLKAMVRLVQAWMKGDYRDVPWRSLIAAVGAILYFLNPFDLIPDFLIGGYADDILVIGWAVAFIRKDLKKFESWEKTIPVEKAF